MKYYVISIKILHLLYDLLPDLIVPEHKHAGKSEWAGIRVVSTFSTIFYEWR